MSINTYTVKVSYKWNSCAIAGILPFVHEKASLTVPMLDDSEIDDTVRKLAEVYKFNWKGEWETHSEEYKANPDKEQLPQGCTKFAPIFNEYGYQSGVIHIMYEY